MAVAPISPTSTGVAGTALPEVAPPARSGVARRPSTSTTTSSREAADLVEVVADPDDREPAPDQVAGQGLHALPVGGVERRGRFVHEHHLRAGQQGAGQAHALRLPAGEVVGRPVEQPRRRGPPARAPRPARGRRRPRRAALEVVADRAGEHGRALEHHPDPPAQLERVHGRQVAARGTGRCPAEGTSSRLARRSSVDFPAPEGPASTVIRPGRTTASTPVEELGAVLGGHHDAVAARARGAAAAGPPDPVPGRTSSTASASHRPHRPRTGTGRLPATSPAGGPAS